ncbi:Catechol 2,3-dioxygenase [Celeribacter baekdonensis]|jgi:catechol 2,3-dioxygenase-like lactoylglutathione lyase family enzyme|uniref:Catechol 2,3-dioxygenase n=1 Tax=Celeribacter baekdonensis TaxID=875171 RepID=A0A1G7NWE5_9RHOB|nr:VOC family protein [Celeribacter baekdonensis]SDF78352.1 Catechol 2,3-dioxygenase [Celeribacter baekdonensis]
MIRGIHHPSLATPNLDTLLPFYQGLLGFEVISTFGWDAGDALSDLAGKITAVPNSTARSALLKAGNAFLEIFEYTQPLSVRSDAPSLTTKGIAHICLDSDDVRTDHALLSAAGVTFTSDPIDVGPMRLCYCQDPDGNFVELQEITDPSSGMGLSA